MTENLLLRVLQSDYEPGSTITFNDKHTCTIIINALGDPDKRKIMNSTIHSSKTVYEILEENDIAQTSLYRKIKELVADGIVIPNGTQRSKDGKTMRIYCCLFSDIQIKINKNEISVQTILNPVIRKKTLT